MRFASLAFQVGGGVGPPTLCFSRIELIFSSLQPSLSLAMKVSALTFTSGLGQDIPGPPHAPPPLRSRPSVVVVSWLGDEATSATSSSGELHRELRALRARNGGGGGIGISGDREPLLG